MQKSITCDAKKYNPWCNKVLSAMQESSTRDAKVLAVMQQL